jgi:hypothetical protein
MKINKDNKIDDEDKFITIYPMKEISNGNFP